MANIAAIVRQHIDSARRGGETAVVTELEALLPAAANGQWPDLDFQLQDRITAINAQIDRLFQGASQDSDEFRAAIRQLDARRAALEALSFSLPGA